jgi:hypothetical protein
LCTFDCANGIHRARFKKKVCTSLIADENGCALSECSEDGVISKRRVHNEEIVRAATLGRRVERAERVQKLESGLKSPAATEGVGNDGSTETVSERRIERPRVTNFALHARLLRCILPSVCFLLECPRG